MKKLVALIMAMAIALSMCVNVSADVSASAPPIPPDSTEAIRLTLDEDAINEGRSFTVELEDGTHITFYPIQEMMPLSRRDLYAGIYLSSVTWHLFETYTQLI